MYVVSVVQQSDPVEPRWLTRHGEGAFIGIGEAPSMDAANRAALDDLMARISREIGVELSATGKMVKSEAGGEVVETANFQLDAFSGSFLRDVVRRVNSSYWQHCRAQTGKKSFNDFFRYYVMAEIPSSLIDTLRVQTRLDNDRKAGRIQESFLRAGGFLQGKDQVRPWEAMGELTGAAQTAASLYYGRNDAVEEVSDRIYDILGSLRITILQAYSEVRPERHYFEYRVTSGGRPASGVKLHFRLTQGRGSIKETAYTDERGVAVCDVYQMQSQASDNQIVASIDISDFADRIGSVRNAGGQPVGDILRRSAESITRSDRFSTTAKSAYVSAGSLIITGVREGRVNGVFRRVRELDLSMSLTEHNGRDVIFNQYAVWVECWYVNDPIFGGKTYSDSKTGSFPLPLPVNVSHSSTRNVTIPKNQAVASLINDLKSAHEIGMRQILLHIVIEGTDDAGSRILVELASEPMTWDRLFER